MAEQKESSVLFSLKELMNLEEDRIKQEEADKDRRKAPGMFPKTRPGIVNIVKYYYYETVQVGEKVDNTIFKRGYMI